MATTRNELKFRRWLGAPRRLVRRRGFGIHSPFAFDFVRRVIASRYSYYAYPQLTAKAREAGISSGKLRLIFRLALFFRPEAIEVSGLSEQKCEAVTAAIKAGSPEARTNAPEAGFLIATDATSRETMRRVAERHGVVVVLGAARKSSGIREVWAASECGMLFRGSNVAILVNHAHLPHQIFDIWI